MPSVSPYIPSRDSLFDLWAANFATLTTATPFLYGISALDALNIKAAYLDFHAAYVPVTSKATRTADLVAVKNSQKVNALAVLRPYAQQISLNAGVTSGDKIALGLNPRTSMPSPISPPSTNPVLTFQSATNLSAIVRYRDSAASVSVKSKPYGVTQIRIYGMVSATAVTDPTVLPFVQSATKSPILMSFPPAAAGRQFYMAAQWATRTGGLSSWSGIISFTVPQVS